MKLEFLGAAHEVTGSCHYLVVGDKHCLIDCGMEQGPDLYENQEIPVTASQIDYIFVTHAHIDHSGMIPLMLVKGFRGQVFATKATTQLCSIMLKDSAHIQEQEAEWKNRKARRSGAAEIAPMYTVEDAQAALNLFVPCEYNKTIEVCDEISIRFGDAGHLLGSSFIEITAREEGIEKRLLFSGDLGNGNRPLIRDPQIPNETDYLIIESTYGDRLHEMPRDFAPELAAVLEETFAKGGNVVIPAFSVGRTQEMLFHLRRIKQEKMMATHLDFEVYLDSPLAIEATNIFSQNVLECFRDENVELIKSGVNPIMFDGLNTAISSEESKAINFIKKPIVIISASGMCEAGRIRHHLKHNLWRPECTVVFVGYQVPGTLGNHLLNGASEVKLFGETIQVKARICNLPGMSGHADRDHLTDWVRSIPGKPERVFVVHGEDQVTDMFAKHLSEELGLSAAAPYSGDAYDLISDTQIMVGGRKRIAKKTAKPKAAASSAAYQRLVNAGLRLTAVIRAVKGLPNKELARFTDQINSLCDKYEK